MRALDEIILSPLLNNSHFKVGWNLSYNAKIMTYLLHTQKSEIEPFYNLKVT